MNSSNCFRCFALAGDPRLTNKFVAFCSWPLADYCLTHKFGHIPDYSEIWGGIPSRFSRLAASGGVSFRLLFEPKRFMPGMEYCPAVHLYASEAPSRLKVGPLADRKNCSVSGLQ